MVIKENLLLIFFVFSSMVGLFSISLTHEESSDFAIEEIEHEIETKKFINTSFLEKEIAKNDFFASGQVVLMFYRMNIYSHPHRGVDTPPPESV